MGAVAGDAPQRRRAARRTRRSRTPPPVATRSVTAGRRRARVDQCRPDVGRRPRPGRGRRPRARPPRAAQRHRAGTDLHRGAGRCRRARRSATPFRRRPGRPGQPGCAAPRGRSAPTCRRCPGRAVHVRPRPCCGRPSDAGAPCPVPTTTRGPSRSTASGSRDRRGAPTRAALVSVVHRRAPSPPPGRHAARRRSHRRPGRRADGRRRPRRAARRVATATPAAVAITSGERTSRSTGPIAAARRVPSDRGRQTAIGVDGRRGASATWRSRRWSRAAASSARSATPARRCARRSSARTARRGGSRQRRPAADPCDVHAVQPASSARPRPPRPGRLTAQTPQLLLDHVGVARRQRAARRRRRDRPPARPSADTNSTPDECSIMPTVGTSIAMPNSARTSWV